VTGASVVINGLDLGVDQMLVCGANALMKLFVRSC
jgi:hypothetical protein